MMSIPNINASWLINPATQSVFSLLDDAGFCGRVVGGAVRNTLLGQPISDIDFAVTARPEQVIELARQAGIKSIPTGLAHGTVTLMVEGEAYELTTLRRDVETNGRHAVVAFTDSWREDAARRDFTMNALYVGAGGKVYDPLNGYSDLDKRRVAFIGRADARIEEDYLRILRFFRFYAQYGSGDIDHIGLEACIRGGHGLAQVSGERIHAELLKMLVAPNAAGAVQALYDSGLFLQIFQQVPRLHRFYSMIAIEKAFALKFDEVMRLAALFVAISEDVIGLDARLRLSKQERQKLGWFVSWQDFDFLDDKALLEVLYYHGQDAVYYGFLGYMLKRQGAGLSGGFYRETLQRILGWQHPTFPLKGQDLIEVGVKSGKALGVQLRALERIWLDSHFSLSREELLRLVRSE